MSIWSRRSRGIIIATADTALVNEDRYDLIERLPSTDDFQRLRRAAEMTPRPREGVKRGLPNSLYGVIVKHCESGGRSDGPCRR